MPKKLIRREDLNRLQLRLKTATSLREKAQLLEQLDALTESEHNEQDSSTEEKNSHQP